MERNFKLHLQTIYTIEDLEIALDHVECDLPLRAQPGAPPSPSPPSSSLWCLWR
jgi:hypothetical protein